LPSDRIDIAEYDVFHRRRINPGAVDQCSEACRAEIGGVDVRESTASLSGRGSNGVNDEGLRHGGSLPHPFDPPKTGLAHRRERNGDLGAAAAGQIRAVARPMAVGLTESA